MANLLLKMAVNGARVAKLSQAIGQAWHKVAHLADSKPHLGITIGQKQRAEDMPCVSLAFLGGSRGWAGRAPVHNALHQGCHPRLPPQGRFVQDGDRSQPTGLGPSPQVWELVGMGWQACVAFHKPTLISGAYYGVGQTLRSAGKKRKRGCNRRQADSPWPF